MKPSSITAAQFDTCQAHPRFLKWQGDGASLWVYGVVSYCQLKETNWTRLDQKNRCLGPDLFFLMNFKRWGGAQSSKICTLW